jgi:hypothetical protein
LHDKQAVLSPSAPFAKVRGSKCFRLRACPRFHPKQTAAWRDSIKDRLFYFHADGATKMPVAI